MLMTAAAYGAPAQACRRPIVPACDPLAPSIGSNPSMIGDPILVRKGDVIDVGLDWTGWIEANGGKISASAFAAHADSPQTPTLTNANLHKDSETLCIVDTAGASVADVYWLVNTITVEGVPEGAFTMPSRTIKRIIAVKVVA